MSSSQSKRHRVVVVYKSGATIDVECDDFTVRTQGGQIAEVGWRNAHPRPLHVGVDDIAAVWTYEDKRR